MKKSNFLKIFFILLPFFIACKPVDKSVKNYTVSERGGKWSINSSNDSGVFIFNRIYEFVDETEETIKRNYQVNKNYSHDTASRRFFLTEIIDPVTWEPMYGINIDEKILFTPGEFDSYESIENNLFLVLKDSNYYVFNTDHKLIIPTTKDKPRYNDDDNVFYVETPDGWFLYTLANKVFGPYDGVEKIGNLITWQKEKHLSGPCAGIINLDNGDKFSLSGYGYDLNFNKYRWSDSLYFVYNWKTRCKGVVNRRGDIVIPIKYSNVLESNDTLPIFIYVENKKLNFYTLNDGKNNETNISIDDIKYSKKELMLVSSDGKKGVINLVTMKFVVPIIYYDIDINDNLTILCKKKENDTKYGILDRAGKFLSFEYYD